MRKIRVLRQLQKGDTETETATSARKKKKTDPKPKQDANVNINAQVSPSASTTCVEHLRKTCRCRQKEKVYEEETDCHE